MDAADDRTRVLLVEDEASYREAISTGLRQEGFAVEVAADGIEGLRLFAERPPDIVLLDLLLPGMHGTEVCRRMRQLAPVPILMVSAVDAELDVVLGLELGAAGYVTKPFRLRELVARMQAILRRVSPPVAGAPGTPSEAGPTGRDFDDPAAVDPEGGPAPEASPARISFGSVTVDFTRREVTVAGAGVHLSRREFDLLATLLTPAGQVRTRDELIDRLWPHQYLADTRTLDTHIHRLRAKLEADSANPQYIVTVRGVGFRIDPEGRHPNPPVPTAPDR